MFTIQLSLSIDFHLLGKCVPSRDAFQLSYRSALIEKGLEQIVTEQERERESNDDDLLFDDDEAITDDDLLFEAVERDIPVFKESPTEEAKVLLGGDSIE